MLKKIMASVLSTTMLFAMLPAMGVFAACPTVALDPVYYSENGSVGKNPATTKDGVALDDFEFEGYGTTVLSSYPNIYYGAAADKGVFRDSSGSCPKVYTLIDDGTNTGNQVLQSYTSSASGVNVYNRTREIKRQETQMIRFSFDVKFPTIGTEITTNRYLYLGREGGGGSFTLALDSNKRPYIVPYETYTDLSTGTMIDTDKWYAVTVVVGVDGWVNSYFSEKDSDVVLVTSASTGVASTAGASFSLSGAYQSKVSADEIANSKTTVWLDNAKLMVYTPANYLPEMIATSAVGDALPRNIKLTFDFDLPVTLGTVTLKQGETTVAGTSASLNGMGDKLTLTYTGLLERGKDYTVSFEGFTSKDSGSAISIDPVSFGTEDLHSWNDVLIGSVTVNTGDNTKTDITFTLSEEYCYGVFSGGVLAALYRDGQMIGVEMQTLDNQNVASAITKSFTLGTSPMAGDKVMLMQVDTVGNILPLASGEFTVE